MSVSIYFPCFIYFFRVWGVNWIDVGDACASQEQYRDLLFWLSSCYGAVHYWFHFSSLLLPLTFTFAPYLSSQQVSPSISLPLTFFPVLHCQFSFKSSKLLFIKLFSFILNIIRNYFWLVNSPQCFGGFFFVRVVAKKYCNILMWRLAMVRWNRLELWIMWFSCLTHPDKWTWQHSWFIYQPVRYRAQVLSWVLFGKTQDQFSLCGVRRVVLVGKLLAYVLKQEPTVE